MLDSTLFYLQKACNSASSYQNPRNKTDQLLLQGMLKNFVAHGNLQVRRKRSHPQASYAWSHPFVTVEFLASPGSTELVFYLVVYGNQEAGVKTLGGVNFLELVRESA